MLYCQIKTEGGRKLNQLIHHKKLSSQFGKFPVEKLNGHHYESVTKPASLEHCTTSQQTGLVKILETLRDGIAWD